jgi:hypothetical protein
MFPAARASAVNTKTMQAVEDVTCSMVFSSAECLLTPWLEPIIMLRTSCVASVRNNFIASVFNMSLKRYFNISRVKLVITTDCKRRKVFFLNGSHHGKRYVKIPLKNTPCAMIYALTEHHAIKAYWRVEV